MAEAVARSPTSQSPRHHLKLQAAVAAQPMLLAAAAMLALVTPPTPLALCWCELHSAPAQAACPRAAARRPSLDNLAPARMQEAEALCLPRDRTCHSCLVKRSVSRTCCRFCSHHRRMSKTLG